MGLVEFNDQKRGRLTLIHDVERLPDTCVPESTPDFAPLAGDALEERFGVLQPIPAYPR